MRIQNKLAFTLAEVLITLAIIGSVIIGVILVIIIIHKRIRDYLKYYYRTNMSFYVKIPFVICFILGFLNLITTAPEISTALFIFPLGITGIILNWE